MTDREPDGRSLNFAGDVDEQGRSDAGFLAERRRSGRKFRADIEALHLNRTPTPMSVISHLVSFSFLILIGRFAILDS
jgi:hypothetical protein